MLFCVFQLPVGIVQSLAALFNLRLNLGDTLFQLQDLLQVARFKNLTAIHDLGPVL